MTIASDILSRRMPDFDYYVQSGESLDDIDEYGFTPLIEAMITRQLPLAEELLKRGVSINKTDVTGRTALHWAVDLAELPLIRLLLSYKADANAYTTSGLSVLVYPILRGQNQIKHLLYQYGANIDFALDFIYGKLLGHRFELKGYVDIVNAAGEFVELNYEGFILEFTVAMMNDSLLRFTTSFSTRQFRDTFHILHRVLDALSIAEELLKFQHNRKLTADHLARITQLMQAPLLILPVANRGHAFCFVRYGEWLAKIDRGENSLKEGSVNIYRITKPQAFNLDMLRNFLYKKQSREYFHNTINQQLGLVPTLQIPMSSQIVGNCSWANVQALIPVCYALQQLHSVESFSANDALNLFEAWNTWDQDRALDECLQRFYTATPIRKASIAAMLAGVFFQSLDDAHAHDLKRAEKIVPILMLPEYYYILKSYLDIYCVRRLTLKGNNLLKLLDDCGVNPNIGITPIATGLDGKS